MAGQCVAVIGCMVDKPNSNVSASQLIKGILETDDLKARLGGNDFSSCYDWKITNKYYEAAVDICLILNKTIGSEEFSKEVEAVIAVFDSTKDSKGLEDLKSWTSYIDVWQPEIKLAVCERCSSIDDDTSHQMSREKAQLWCLDHGFELVEMDPVADDYSEFEDFGLTRIRKALAAHMWPHMQLKNECQSRQTTDKNQKVDKTEEKTNEGCSEGESKRKIEASIDALLAEPEELDDDFESLFQKMRVFKESAAAMPMDSRKDYAEKVVSAFWKALGGDEDEFADLSSDDES